MSLATALLTPILGDASPWGPQRLFQLGEAGAWYDPSDLTAEKVAWRRNLLTWSEDFTNAAWTKTRSSITPNAGTSWDGTATASKLVEDTSTNTHILQFVNVSVGGTVGDTTPYCFSVYAKAAERTAISLFDNGQSGAGSGNSSFDLSAGTVISGTGQIVAAGGGWHRCIIFPSRTAGTLATPQVRLLGPPGNVNSYTGDGTSGVLIDSAQLEASPTATAYQRITDFTSDFLAAFPTHALYQDSAGTTPVTALGQPVGLAIDKSRGGLASLGAELVTNGDFSSGSAGWTLGVGWSVGSGVATKAAGTGDAITRTAALTASRTYRVSYTVSGATAGTCAAVLVGGTQVTGLLSGANGDRVEYVTAVSGNSAAGVTANGAFNGSIDNISVREVPGVHAIQPTSASRPLLDGRVNLLTFSEQFDNAAWTKTGATVTANAGVAPDGTTTADLVYPTATGTNVGVFQGLSFQTTTYDGSFYLKASGKTFARLYEYAGVSLAASIDLATGTVSNVLAGYTATATSSGNGWWRLQISGAVSAGTRSLRVIVTDSATTTTATANGTDGILIWGADLRLATDAAYPYQRVAAATDYADVGVPRSFLFDGFDDSLYTASNMDLSGTDKVTVLAGVRKLSDAALGIVAEHTSSLNANNGSFWLMNGDGTVAAGPIWQYASKGTVNAFATSPSSYASPVTSVLAGLSNIAGDSVLLRVNGAQVASATFDQGTGNYANAVFYIGRRGNTSLPFNGKAYQLIVRGALTDTATLAQAERYVGAKTGLYI